MALVPKVPVSMHETFCETLLRAYYELLVVIAIRAVAAVSVTRDKLGVWPVELRLLLHTSRSRGVCRGLRRVHKGPLWSGKKENYL